MEGGLKGGWEGGRVARIRIRTLLHAQAPREPDPKRPRARMRRRHTRAEALALEPRHVLGIHLGDSVLVSLYTQILPGPIRTLAIAHTQSFSGAHARTHSLSLSLSRARAHTHTRSWVHARDAYLSVGASVRPFMISLSLCRHLSPSLLSPACWCGAGLPHAHMACAQST